MRIYIDMDGVLCDLVGSLRKLYNYTDEWPKGEYDLKKVFGPSVWERITEAGEDFWMNMEMTPEAERIMELMQKRVYYIASSPTLDPYSASGKMHWLQMNFPCVRRQFFITPHKYLLARPGDILVDDSDDQIAKWRSFGGVGVLIPRPWNQLHMDDPSEGITVLESLL